MLKTEEIFYFSLQNSHISFFLEQESRSITRYERRRKRELNKKLKWNLENLGCFRKIPLFINHILVYLSNVPNSFMLKSVLILFHTANIGNKP